MCLRQASTYEIIRGRTPAVHAHVFRPLSGVRMFLLYMG